MDVCTGGLRDVVGLLKIILTVMQIAIPIILLIFGTLDLGKAVMAGDEKEIKAATSTLIKRVVAAVAVFLLFLVISIITGWVGGDEWTQCWKQASTNVSINTGLNK